MDAQQPEVNSVRLALEEMRLAMDKKWQASDTLSTSGYQLLGAAGVILVLAVTITGTPTDSLLKTIYVICLSFAFLLYLIMLGLVLQVAQPESFTTGIKANWKVLDDAVIRENELEALLNIVKTYIDALPLNESINQRRAKYIRWTMYTLVAIVFLLVFARTAAAWG